MCVCVKEGGCDVIISTDNRTAELLGVLQDITDHYQDTLESLRVINETLAGVQEMVQGMSSAIHSQLDWVVGQLGGANCGLRYSHTPPTLANDPHPSPPHSLTLHHLFPVMFLTLDVHVQ